MLGDVGGDDRRGSPHFLELDGMRGVLASAVMLYHLGLNPIISRLTRDLVHDGAWGLSVDFFFMLSGFVLCQSFLHRAPSLGEYATKRLLRLYPLFILTTLLALAFYGGPDLSVRTLVANLLAVQSLLTVPSINFPAWSIPFELVLPALLIPTASPLSERPTLAMAVLGLCLALSSACAWLYAGGPDGQWLRALSGLAGGGALFVVWRARRGEPPKPAATISLCFFGLAIAAMALSGAARGLNLLFPILSAAAIWFGAGACGLFSTAPFQALGAWSYSIYLLHIPMLMAAERVFGRDHVAGSVPIKLGVIVACLAAAALSYRFIESPFITLGRKLTARRPAPS